MAGELPTVHPPSLYGYEAKLDHFIDGDSISLVVKLGFRIATDPIDCRLQGIDAPEVFHPHDDMEEQAGQKAKKYLSTLVGTNPLRIRSHVLGKYGRPVITLYVQTADGWVDANDAMVTSGNAVRYDGEGPRWYEKTHLPS